MGPEEGGSAQVTFSRLKLVCSLSFDNSFGLGDFMFENLGFK